MSRTALITGASRRIGAAIARNLARDGWHVVAHSRGPNDDLATLLHEAEALSGQISPLYADLTDEQTARALLAGAAKVTGSTVNLLVNNASIFDDDTIHTADWRSFDKHMTVHVKVPMTLSQAFAAQEVPEHEKRSDRLIVNIVDQRVQRLNPLFTTYTLSKAALWTLTQTLAQGLAPNIRVNAIGPGPTLANSFQGTDDFDNEAANVPLERATDPDDIAAAIAFLWASKSVTGQLLALDGGQHLAWKTPDVISGGGAGSKE